MIHDMSATPDERAGAEAAYRYLTGVIGDLDPHQEAVRIAQVVCRAARPKMWLRHQDDIARLEQEVGELRAHLSGGLCPHCGMAMP